MEKSIGSNTDNLKLGIFSILVAVFSLSIGDAIIKSYSIAVPLWQMYVVRSMIALPILIVIIKLTQPSLTLIPKSIQWVALRSLLLGCMWVAYYAALPHIDLSVAAAIYYTIPLFITLFSAWFTQDSVSYKSWAAIITGFVGVLIIVRPTTNALNIYMFLPLLAAILYAIAMILTRTKCIDESPKILSLSLNVMFIVMGLIATMLLTVLELDDVTRQSNTFLLGNWRVLDAQGWLVMSALGVVIILGSWFAAIAYQNGPSQIIASFDYSYLVFSVIWGLVFFAETPDGRSIVGMVLIVAAGLTIIRAS